MKEPTWPNVHYPPIDYQSIIYYSAPKAKTDGPKSLDEVDPEAARDLREARHPAARAGQARRRRRGRGLRLRLRRDDLPASKLGEGRRSSSARSRRRCRTIRSSCKKYLGSVVPYTDNFFATLNSAVFSRRLLLLHPEGRPLPDGAVDLLPDQLANTGQFERTLIIAEEGAYVSYLEGCTAPMRDENQLHAAVVELVALDERRDQVLDRPELVPRRQGRQGRHLQLRDEARRLPRDAAPRSPGPRSRPARRSPGSTRAASSRATTRSASSTRSP